MLRQSDRAPGLLLGDRVNIDPSVSIGGNVVIHDNTIIEADVRIEDGVVLGKPPIFGQHSRARRDAVASLFIAQGSAICANAVVLSGASIGKRAVVGDQAHVRERAVVGDETVVGQGVAVDNDVFIGDRVRIQTGCYLTAFTRIEDEVFVAPCVTTTNDNSMGRRQANQQLVGATMRRGCRVGAGSILLPGIELGEQSFVAAGALVTRDVDPGMLVMGVPAKAVRATDTDT
jgi:acetyltransferase-like isoleucine patch superfamily enzyme